MGILSAFFTIVEFAVFAGLIVAAFFLLINRRSSQNDESSYTDEDAHLKQMAKHSLHREAEEMDPMESLKRYQVPDS